MNKKHAVWGRDKTFRWLWVAAVIAGVDACKLRYSQGKKKIARRNWY